MADKKSKLTLVKLNQADLAKGRHVLIVESPDSRRAVSLNANVFSIGRHPNNDLVLSDLLASRHHATVAWMKYTEGNNKVDYSYWIIDGKGKKKRSRNGISINGKRKTLHRLVSGDTILIGDEIKIHYNYIDCTNSSSEFLNHYDHDREDQPIFNSKKSYKDTVVIENVINPVDIPEDSSIIEQEIRTRAIPEDSSIIDNTIIKGR